MGDDRKVIPSWLIALIIIIGLYIIMRYVVGLPTPLVNFYMIFIIAGAVIHITLNDRGIEEIKNALNLIATGKMNPAIRLAVLLILPVFIAYGVYAKVRTSYEPPPRLFTPHPTPPQWVVDFEIPEWVADFNRWDQAHINEGKKIYEDNCLVCHGENADGKGPMASAIRYPASPTNFKEPGTIAQLPLSYVYWRVRDGGIRDRQFKSAMPGWGEELDDEEIWKVIMYIYTKAGVKPRTWE